MTMDHDHDPITGDLDLALLDDPGADDPDPARATGPQVLQRWAAVAGMAGVIAAGALLGAGAVLSEAELGRASVARGCDPGLGGGLLLLAFAGALLGFVRIAVDWRFPQEVLFDNARFWALLPVPALLLILTAPAFLGCEVATEVANVQGLGRALTGTPGIALAGASAMACGLVPTMAVRMQVSVSQIIAHYEQMRAPAAAPDPVEAALAKLDDAGWASPVPQQYDTQTGARLDSVVAQEYGADPSAYEPGAHPVTEPTYSPEHDDQAGHGAPGNPDAQ
jgi:hypothetical protein